LDRAEEEYRLAVRQGAGGVLAEWYQQRAVDCEAARQDATALWYLNRAAALLPADAEVFSHRADLHAQGKRFNASAADWTRALELRPNAWHWYAERAGVYAKLGKEKEREADLAQAAARGAGIHFLAALADERTQAGRWADAAALFARAEKKGGMPLAYWQRWALACLKSGDPGGYRRLSTLLLAGYPNPAIDATVATRIGLILSRGPGAVRDWTVPLALAEGLAAGLPPSQVQKRSELLRVAGALFYRAGRHEDALKCLKSAIAADKGKGAIQDWLFLAMTHHRLGHADEARKWLGQGLAHKDKGTMWEKVEVELLRDEAKSLLGIGPAIDKGAKQGQPQ
jgi:tetratricopeptide (TPR) repeat protein